MLSAAVVIGALRVKKVIIKHAGAVGILLEYQGDSNETLEHNEACRGKPFSRH